MSVTTLLGNQKGLVEVGNPSTRAEVKLCLFLHMPALGIVRRETEVLKRLLLAKYELIPWKNLSLQIKKNTISHCEKYIHKKSKERKQFS